MADVVYIHIALAADSAGRSAGKSGSIWSTVNDPDTRVETVAYAADKEPANVVSTCDDALAAFATAGKILVGHDLNLTLMILRDRYSVEFERSVDVACYMRFLGLQDSFENLWRLVGADPPQSPEEIIDVIRSAAARLFADKVYMKRDVYIARRTAQENLKGLSVDKRLATTLKKQMSAERFQLLQRFAREFPFVSTDQLNDEEHVRAECERQFGVKVPSLSRKDPDLAALRRANVRLSEFLELRYRYLRLAAGGHDLEKIIVGPDRLYFPLEFFGAHTGRFTSSGEQVGSVNIQGSPRGGKEGLEVFDEFRSIFRADEAESWIACDSSIIEPRILALLADQQNLLERLRAGDDPYIWFMEQVFPGVKIEKHGVNQNLRRLGKTCINGLGYGEGFDKFRGDVLAVAPETDEEQIRAAYDGYYSLFPAVVNLRSRFMRMFEAAMKDKVGDRGYPAGKCRFTRVSDVKETGLSIAVELPTGRSLYYRSLVSTQEYRNPNGHPKSTTILRYAPWLSLKPPSSPKVPSQMRVGLRETTLINNVVQSISRDIVLAQWHEIEKTHPELRVRFSNQDELIIATARCTCHRRDDPIPPGASVDANHDVTCPWIAGRKVVREIMSRVPACFEKLKDLPLACELSDSVRDAWGK